MYIFGRTCAIQLSGVLKCFQGISDAKVILQKPLFGIVFRSYGVMAITLDFESNNPSSNLGRTLIFTILKARFLKTARTVARHKFKVILLKGIFVIKYLYSW